MYNIFTRYDTRSGGDALTTYKTTGNIIKSFYKLNLSVIDKEYDGTNNALIHCQDTKITYDKALYTKSNVGIHSVNIENIKLLDKIIYY